MKTQKQTGSAHAIVIVILIVVILGLLGFVFLQNVLKKQSTVATGPTATATASAAKPITYKTYTTDVYGVSFQYPDTWSLGNVIKTDETDNVSRSVNITTPSGQVVSFEVGIRGLGGTCDAPATYKVIDASNANISGQSVTPTYYSFVLQPGDNGTFTGYYGLTNEYNTLGDVQVCPNTFYFLFLPSNTDLGAIRFNSKRVFADEAQAKAYVNSDEYAAIKKMVTSIKY